MARIGLQAKPELASSLRACKTRAREVLVTMGGPEARLPVLLLRKSTARLGPPHTPPALEPRPRQSFHSALGGIGGRSPPIANRVECKVGSRSEPDLCTDEGGTRVSAYVARLSNKTPSVPISPTVAFRSTARRRPRSVRVFSSLAGRAYREQSDSHRNQPKPKLAAGARHICIRDATGPCGHRAQPWEF